MDGGRIRPAALVRTDSPHELTADGIAALRAHGISRIIDLRSADDPMYRRSTGRAPMSRWRNPRPSRQTSTVVCELKAAAAALDQRTGVSSES